MYNDDFERSMIKNILYRCFERNIIVIKKNVKFFNKIIHSSMTFLLLLLFDTKLLLRTSVFKRLKTIIIIVQPFKWSTIDGGIPSNERIGNAFKNAHFLQTVCPKKLNFVLPPAPRMDGKRFLKVHISPLIVVPKALNFDFFPPRKFRSARVFS